MTSFIARLSVSDEYYYQRGEASGIQEAGNLRARVSPDGRWLAFMSNNDLAGYDTRDVNTGKPDEEVYLYHAPEDLETGQGTLACASCDPTGARPVVAEGENRATRIAAIVPGWQGELYHSHGFLYQPRYLSDEGRLFFDSADALVPLDVDGATDVYEYEPENVPADSSYACSAASTSGSEVFKPAHRYETEGREGEEGAGCVALISSGTSPNGSTFLEASEGGGDVFFMTTSKLASQQFGVEENIYDAQECTAAVPCPPAQAQQPPECNTEASCKARPTPQPEIYGAPASATFSGPGNIAPQVQAPAVAPVPKKKAPQCKRNFTKNKKGKCIRKKQKRSRRAKKSSYDRRAGR
jgi:hypothetical protein